MLGGSERRRESCDIELWREGQEVEEVEVGWERSGA